LRGLRLGRLPYARDESQAIARHVGSADVLLGANATERAVKSRPLRNYDVVHVAAHAVADDTYPERSAVMLAPGDRTEDGLLQAREIAALDLEGRIVVLSACQTAAGAILSGEGVLSLARAFFEAGAHAVIGTRWPLRDEDGAVLFEMFYRHLAGGASLSDALRATREEARTAGRPASAWAGLVLIGNGDLRPLAARRAPATSSRQLLAPLAALAILAVLGIALSRHRM
jgi:CHAT domain-containing protein